MEYVVGVVIYGVIVWWFLPLIVPHLSARKQPISEDIPQEFLELLQYPTKDSESKYALVERLYEYVTSKYSGGRLGTLVYMVRAFQKNPFKQKAGYMHCMAQNHIIRTLLLKSGRFEEGDIELVIQPLNLFIHQYLRVRINGEWIVVDPWASSVGVPLGEKADFFQ